MDNFVLNKIDTVFIKFFSLHFLISQNNVGSRRRILIHDFCYKFGKIIRSRQKNVIKIF